MRRDQILSHRRERETVSQPRRLFPRSILRRAPPLVPPSPSPSWTPSRSDASLRTTMAKKEHRLQSSQTTSSLNVAFSPPYRRPPLGRNSARSGGRRRRHMPRLRERVHVPEQSSAQQERRNRLFTAFYFYVHCLHRRELSGCRRRSRGPKNTAYCSTQSKISQTDRCRRPKQQHSSVGARRPRSRSAQAQRASPESSCCSPQSSGSSINSSKRLRKRGHTRFVWRERLRHSTGSIWQGQSEIQGQDHDRNQSSGLREGYAQGRSPRRPKRRRKLRQVPYVRVCRVFIDTQ